jgi:hypothetical protein
MLLDVLLGKFLSRAFLEEILEISILGGTFLLPPQGIFNLIKRLFAHGEFARISYMVELHMVLERSVPKEGSPLNLSIVELP